MPHTIEQDDWIKEQWQRLMDKDDRNSPSEYPDMCLITAKEFWELATDAFLLGRPKRYTVGPSGLGSWLVFDTLPEKIQRSNWSVEKDAHEEANRLNELNS